MYIAFEGGDGSGKGEQIRLLEGTLTTMRFDVITVVEPGGTLVSDAIREILLNRKELKFLGLTEFFLFSAARSQLIPKVVVPALSLNKIVLSDRYFASSLAYQGGGRGLDPDMILETSMIAVGNVVPDLTILLDLDPEIGLGRKKSEQELNRLDAEDLAFHQKARQVYLDLAEQDPEHWYVFDAALSIEKLHTQILELVLSKLG